MPKGIWIKNPFREIQEGNLAEPNREDAIDFHMPGKHDQSTHGRRYGGHKRGPKRSGSKPKSATSATKSLRDRIDELGLNEWPKKDKVAQEVLGDAKDTQELHSIPNEEGGRSYSSERHALHNKIIDDLLHGHRPPADGRKRALFMGGGTASGKSSALKLNPQAIPNDAVTIDPDEIKGKLPEYQRLTEAGSKYNAGAAHEESSDVAKRLRKEASDRGLNVVVDGTGDSRKGKFAGKIQDAINDGYEPDVFYVNAPTDVAIDRSIARAQKTGRFVPVPEVRNQHRGVSQNFPEVAALPGVRDLYLYQTEGDPVLMAKGQGGNLEVHEPDLYDAFLSKAEE